MLHDHLEATVGFEKTFYQVNESSGTVEICAVVYEPDIDCPIQIDFNVTFETGNETKGTGMYVHAYNIIHMVTIMHWSIDIDCPIQMDFGIIFETGNETEGTGMYMHICNICHMAAVAL